jgi:succinyl-CoA synthetase beta subunit
MKLIEADGKRLLRDTGITVPDGRFFDFNDDSHSFIETVLFPCVLKAQVLQGRRGKRGWIRRCENADGLLRNLAELREELHDVPCAGFLVEQELPHKSEWLISVTIDCERGIPVVSYSAEGGMGVAVAASVPIKSSADVALLDISANVKDVLVKLVDLFFKQDMLSIEINPLAITVDGSCVALDAKVELDDAAAFRHPEWSSFCLLSESGRRLSERETAYAKRQEQAGHRGTLGRYVELDGNIAMILSGGGASLVAIDALKKAGGKPANYVEMSGNPDPDAVREAVKIVLSKPGIKAIWIAGSFANFTDIQATVGATLQAVADTCLNVPVVIRRDGPNAQAAQDDAKQWAVDYGITVRFDRADTDLDVSAQAVVAASKTL